MYLKNVFRQFLHFKSSINASNTAAIKTLLLRENFRSNLQVVRFSITTFSWPSAVDGYYQKILGDGAFSKRKGKQRHIFRNSLFHIVHRTAVIATMAQQNEVLVPKSEDIAQNNVTVIRYQPGDERFQMQITLHNGKVLNFDRKVTDSVSNVVARMVTNISKKVKTFGGTVRFLVENGNELNGDEDTTEMEKLLKLALSNSSDLKIQVDEHVYEVVLNPPEFYVAKFFSVYMPTFPLFPYRMETSNNFDKIASQYKWEFSREKPTPEVPPKIRKKSKEGETTVGQNCASPWVACGSTLTFTPDLGMEGGYLRFSCTPSNGKVFGKPFSTLLLHPIAPLQVDTFLYLERLSRLNPKREESDCLRVLSYNVLADTYATPEWFFSSPKDSLDAGYRLPILNKEIKSYQADLVCLQEVDEKYFEGNFEPYLSMEGYKGRHTSKTGYTKEGIATFHNPAKFTEMEYHRFVILEHMKTLPLWERLKTVTGDFIQKLEERNTVFQLSIFQVNHCAKKTILVVGNVHLYFHPDADHIRLLQTITCINILEKKVAQLRSNHPDQQVAVIFCGDFNCTPPFSSYRLLTTGRIDENDEDWTSHSEEKISPGISIQHSLGLTNSHPGEELTNITTAFEGCLDYILYQTEHFELLSTCPPPTKDELTALLKLDEPRKVSLPNFYTPSDHLPLLADLKIKS